jgi:hypothetical protein
MLGSFLLLIALVRPYLHYPDGARFLAFPCINSPHSASPSAAFRLECHLVWLVAFP